MPANRPNIGPAIERTRLWTGDWWQPGIYGAAGLCRHEVKMIGLTIIAAAALASVAVRTIEAPRRHARCRRDVLAVLREITSGAYPTRSRHATDLPSRPSRMAMQVMLFVQARCRARPGPHRPPHPRRRSARLIPQCPVPLRSSGGSLPTTRRTRRRAHRPTGSRDIRTRS